MILFIQDGIIINKKRITEIGCWKKEKLISVKYGSKNIGNCKK